LDLYRPNSLDLDSDGDGASDAFERSSGTDPYDVEHPNTMPVSTLAVLLLAIANLLAAKVYLRKLDF
jgi:hypothetical protein